LLDVQLYDTMTFEVKIKFPILIIQFSRKGQNPDIKHTVTK